MKTYCALSCVSMVLVLFSGAVTAGEPLDGTAARITDVCGTKEVVEIGLGATVDEVSGTACADFEVDIGEPFSYTAKLDLRITQTVPPSGQIASNISGGFPVIPGQSASSVVTLSTQSPCGGIYRIDADATLYYLDMMTFDLRVRLDQDHTYVY